MRSILGIVIVVILYGSLYPFNFIWIDLTTINWSTWLFQFNHRTTNGDVLSNFLTFLPLGYFAFFSGRALRGDNRVLLSRFVLIVSFTFLYAFGLQVAQFLLPKRVPAIGDVMVNIAGTISGLVIAIGQYQWLKRHPDVAKVWSQQYSTPLLLIVCGILYQLFPFVIDFSAHNLANSSNELLRASEFKLSELFIGSVFWLVFFILLEANPFRQWNRLKTALVALVILVIKLLVVYNSVTFTDLLTVAIALLALQLIQRRKVTPALITMLSLIIVLKELLPWWGQSNNEVFNWLPFRYYLSGSMWANTFEFLELLYLYGALLYFLSQELGEWMKSTLLVTAFVASMELTLWLFELGRPDVTKPILTILMGYIFFRFANEQHLQEKGDQNTSASRIDLKVRSE